MIPEGNISLSQQSSSALSQCATYFHLVQKVGSKGKYQNIIFIIFVIVLYSLGIAQIGTVFFFIQMPYNCPDQGLLVQSCPNSVCLLPTQLQSQFADSSFKSYTIPIQFGYQSCQSDDVNFVYGFIFFGGTLSMMIRSFVVDNVGRKPVILAFITVLFVGSIFALSSIHIWVTGIGLFLVNCGSEGATKMGFAYLAEYFDPKLRQIYSIYIQLFYTVGVGLVCLSSYLIADWRITACIFMTFPSLICLILAYIYVRQTPKYLIMKGVQQTVKVLNEIAVINNRQKITAEDVKSVIANKTLTGPTQYISPFILFKHPSLRLKSVCFLFILYIVMTLYYGSSLLIDNFNLNPYLVGLVLTMADFTVYYPASKLIPTLKRKKASIILSFTIAVMAILLILIEPPQNCYFCAQMVIQVIILLIFRFSVNFIYVLALVYSGQLFPQKVRLTMSILQLLGSLSMVINPALISFFTKSEINPMIYFCIIAIFGILLFELLPETDGVLREQIDQPVKFQAKHEKESIVSVNESSYS